MGKYTFKITTSNYYNDSNTSGGDGYYLGNKRKVRMTISPTNASGVAWYASNLKIKEAYISIPMTSSYVNTDTLNLFYGSTSSSVNTVFPNKTDSGVVASAQSIPQKCRFYPANETHYFDITPIIKYAQSNWLSSTWYLWYYSASGNSTAVKFNAPTITVVAEESGAPFVYVNNEWKPVTPYIYNNSKWNLALSHVYSGGWKFNDNLSSGTITEYTYPTASMGSRNSNLACSSSQYADGDSYYNAVHVLGYNTKYGWMSSGSASGPWLQIHLPYPTYDITLSMTNSSQSNKRNGPISGKFLYTNTKGMAYNEASMLDTGVTFSGRDGQSTTATTHVIGNNYPIQNIVIKCVTWDKTNGGFCSIGKVSITGKYFA